ncbi:MAG: hypothetical protein KJO29_08705, partial [Bacteroidia bacterium]|nr:hypothetical protein [Bacteroidia bacterium]
MIWNNNIVNVSLFFFAIYFIAGCYTPVEQYSEAGHGDYVGVISCVECHQKEYDEWNGSHHERSMDIASERTVKGDFNDHLFKSKGVTSRFYRDKGGFYVNTEGPEGKYGDFEIKYTFGVYPLQQYMVEFPGGNIQCLLYAWDAENNKWFDLNSGDQVANDDWMHWTKGSMTWNTMCADCHSTNLKKNYDELDKTYNTTYDIINVSCEACHGPGETHVAYVNSDAYQDGQRIDGSLMYQPVAQDKKELIDECARCHSRRGPVTEFYDHKGTFLDHYLPSTVAPVLYHSDGQILEEVYVYGSFLQSKMYDRNVSCIDCHNPHSLELKFEGNSLCTQCHVTDDYNKPDHHFHDPGTEGSECISCHMPGRVYMGNDYRRDHSFRVPRPDLSHKYGTPNACND